MVPHPTETPCPNGTEPACGLYEGFAVVPCLCTMGTTAKQCTDARPRAELAIQRIESMAHMWLQMFGLQRVVKWTQRAAHRDLGLKVDGLKEMFIPVAGRSWSAACEHACAYTSELCAIGTYRSVGGKVKALIGTNDITHCDGDPASIALRLGRVASLLAWNGLEACDEEAVEGTLPAEYGQQHNTWVVIEL